MKKRLCGNNLLSLKWDPLETHFLCETLPDRFDCLKKFHDLTASLDEETRNK
jgi:23S rRNA A1618 N6-methylase RlmF